MVHTPQKSSRTLPYHIEKPSRRPQNLTAHSLLPIKLLKQEILVLTVRDKENKAVKNNAKRQSYKVILTYFFWRSPGLLGREHPRSVNPLDPFIYHSPSDQLTSAGKRDKHNW